MNKKLTQLNQNRLFPNHLSKSGKFLSLEKAIFDNSLPFYQNIKTIDKTV